MRNYRDLIVWQKSMAMVTAVYRFSRSYPKEEANGITGQIRRCAVSVPSNIAEGYGRNSTQDYLCFLNISNGSLFELQTLLEISRNHEYITEDIFETCFDMSREMERMLSSLIRKVGKS